MLRHDAALASGKLTRGSPGGQSTYWKSLCLGFKDTCYESLHGDSVRASDSAVGRGMASLVVLATFIRDARFALMGARYVEAP
jgi:hypothetical protein